MCLQDDLEHVQIHSQQFVQQNQVMSRLLKHLEGHGKEPLHG